MPSHSVMRRYWSSAPSGKPYSGSGTCGKPGSNTWKCVSQLSAGTSKRGLVFVSNGRIGNGVSTTADLLCRGFNGLEQQCAVESGNPQRTGIGRQGIHAADHHQLLVTFGGATHGHDRLVDPRIVVVAGHAEFRGEVVRSD